MVKLMEKYKPIRQLMADGEFSKALDHLRRSKMFDSQGWR